MRAGDQLEVASLIFLLLKMCGHSWSQCHLPDFMLRTLKLVKPLYRQPLWRDALNGQFRWYFFERRWYFKRDGVKTVAFSDDFPPNGRAFSN